MGKWGIDNQICVKITIRKGVCDYDVIYYRNKLPLWVVEQWRWYFDYLAALVKVNNPRLKVELTICAQTLKQGQEYIEEKTKTLLERLIGIFTDKGDVVIDPCAGSGTTLLAAANMGRKAYGFEVNKGFYSDARNKVMRRIQPNLFT